MAQIVCPSCYSLVEVGLSCPKCGKYLPRPPGLTVGPNPKSNKGAMVIVVAVFGLLILGFTLGVSGLIDKPKPGSIASLQQDKGLIFRQEFAKSLERSYRAAGLNFNIYLTGPEQRVLRMESIAMNEDTIGAIISKQRVLSGMKDEGFSSIVFSNGIRTWTYDIARGTLDSTP